MEYAGDIKFYDLWRTTLDPSHAGQPGRLPALGLADASYRSEEKLKNAPIERVVALGREGKEHAEVDTMQYPHTEALAAKLKTPDARAVYRARVPAVQPAGAAPVASRVEARMHGVAMTEYDRPRSTFAGPCFRDSPDRAACLVGMSRAALAR